MASGASGIDWWAGRPRGARARPGGFAVAPVFDVTVGQDDLAWTRTTRCTSESGLSLAGRGRLRTGGRRAAARWLGRRPRRRRDAWAAERGAVARRVCVSGRCVAPVSRSDGRAGHEYLLRWRAVHDDEAEPMSAEGDGASRRRPVEPWRACACGWARRVGPMVDLRDVDADEVGRALGLAGSQSRHSEAMAVGARA